MNRKQHSGMFLMEMIVVILFFILCAAICIETFVKADSMSRKAVDLNRSVQVAQTVAEVWKSEGKEGLQKRLKAAVSGDGDEASEMWFDAQGEPCEAEEAVFKAEAEPGPKDMIKVIVSQGGKEIYALEAAGHEAVR